MNARREAKRNKRRAAQLRHRKGAPPPSPAPSRPCAPRAPAPAPQARPPGRLSFLFPSTPPAEAEAAPAASGGERAAPAPASEYRATLRYILLGLAALVLSAFASVALIVKIVLAPAAGEWSAPVRIGPLRVDIGVPTAIRLATAPWFAPRLAGRSFDTRHGTLRFAWHDQDGELEMLCAPCTAALPALDPKQPLRLEQLRMRVRRDGDFLDGTLEAAQADPSEQSEAMLHARWSGRLTQQSLQLRIDSAPAPIAQWYALLVPGMAELGHAQIRGTLELQAQLALPSGQLRLQPRVRQLRVEGLDVAARLAARTPCGPPVMLSEYSWIGRALVAAEDPRYLLPHADDDFAEVAAMVAGTLHYPQRSISLGQRLAESLVDNTGPSGERALRERLYVAEIEDTLGRDGVVRDRLAHAPWGARVCGAEAAARRYFRTSARTLAPAQAVWLAAMQPAPDAALEQWQRDQRLDPARIQTVAEAMRGITRDEREALALGLARYDQAPPRPPLPSAP